MLRQRPLAAVGPCLGKRKQFGLEVPNEEGHTWVKAMRHDGRKMMYNVTQAQGREMREGGEVEERADE